MSLVFDEGGVLRRPFRLFALPAVLLALLTAPGAGDPRPKGPPAAVPS